MCRKTKFGEIAYQHALNSTMNFRHGAIITKGSKIIVSGHNHNRSTILGQIHTSVHAEIAVASKLINQRIRKKTSNKYGYKNHLKKYIIWVVRAPQAVSVSELNQKFKNSLPCRLCVNKLLELGFSKIGYSNTNGDMVVTHLNKINTTMYSSSQRIYGQYFKY
jgi:deoxycytidylate deaminase